MEGSGSAYLPPRVDALSKVLVIGRSGQLARALDTALRAGGHEVTLWGRQQLDLCDAARAASSVAALQADVIINAAAFTDVDAAEDDRRAAMAVNCHGPEAVARAAAAMGADFIHVSTDYVFDGEKAGPYREDDMTGPLNVYGESKRAGEVAVMIAHPRSVVLRTSWLFSGSGRNFLTTMVRLSGGEGPLRVVMDQVGQPTSAADLASAIERIVRDLKRGARPEQSGIFHAAGAEPASWYEFATAIMEALEARGHHVRPVTPIPGSEYATRARRPLNSRLDGTKLHQAYGVSLPGWRASLPAAIDEYLKNNVRSGG